MSWSYVSRSICAGTVVSYEKSLQPERKQAFLIIPPISCTLGTESPPATTQPQRSDMG